ncbi:MAG: hypothetical protein ACFFA5_05395 [Promethearchaeota archaeon]
MEEISVSTKLRLKKMVSVRRYFDGIKFLWQIPETRYLLKLIVILLTSMTIFYTTLTLLIVTFGETRFLLRFNLYGLPFFLVLFLFIFIKLVRFYRNTKKHALFPERNSLLKMKYYSSPDLKAKKESRLPKIVVILIFLFLLVFVFATEFFFVYEMHLVLISIYAAVFLSFIWIVYGLLFITAFMSARGTMRLFNATYSERVRNKSYWFFIFLPLPWILFFILYFIAGEVLFFYRIFGGFVILWFLSAQVLYGFLCLTSIFSLLKKNWRVGYTVSQVAASLTFFTVIIIPGIIGYVQDSLSTILPLIGLGQIDTSGGASNFYLGPLVSLLAMGFLYIQGTLDDYGDKLREYYAAWDNKLETFNIKSEEDFQNQTYDKVFDDTPLSTEVPNAYPNLIFGLILLLFTFFGIILESGAMFSVLGVAIGTEQITDFLFISSYLEFWGIILGLFVYTVIISFRKQENQQ